MKIANTKKEKTIIYVLGFILIFVAVALFFSSYIAKYLIEKYDEKFTGRRITVGWVYVNPINGYIHLHNLNVFESKTPNTLTNQDSVFLSVKAVSANFALRKLISKTIEISKLTLNQPRGIIIQNKKDLNFNDIIATFTPNKTDTIPSVFKFNLLKIKIKKGEFHYREQLIPIDYFIKEVNVESPGISHNVDTVAVNFSFSPGIGTGNANGNITINLKKLDYNLAILVQKFDLDIIQQYLKDLTNYGTFTANLDADFHSKGNFKVVDSVTNKGVLVINDFHFGKTVDEDYASFKKLVLAIHEVSPGKHIYWYDSVMLEHPYFKYERYDELDNLQTMFGEKGSNISAVKADPEAFNLVLEIAHYAKKLAKNFYKSNYKIDKLMIENGDVRFNDYSLTEKFTIEANPLTIYADSINKLNKRVKIAFKSGIKPYGDMWINLSINPNDSSDFNMQYQLQGMPLAMFNPYTINFTSYPMDRGTLELNGKWDVKNGGIKSENHLLVIDPRLNLKIKNDDKKHIPLPLIMYLIRERGNVIDYTIPITGNLNDPTFHVNDVVFDVLGNIFVKPPSITYRTEIKNIENEIEKSLSLKWMPLQQAMISDQLEFINKMADFLKNNPEEIIDVYSFQYGIKEKEHILFFEAKKKYFLAMQNDKNKVSLSEKDSIDVVQMSVKDDEFIRYLKHQANDSMLFTVQDLCAKLVGYDVVKVKFEQLINKRDTAFMAIFRSKGVNDRVRINKSINEIPYNGFSFYKIEYKGEFPADLVKAYKKLDKFDAKPPRKRFEKKRKKTEALVQ